ncbi:uncharacterized protein LOC134270185 [Saccostrea cucullata]|uniref:uncharacterized protein LOC134270185 n=1 Tax=Saccostrea cuccullata TaxID=36930 RepID=UPI002ED0E0C4
MTNDKTDASEYFTVNTTTGFLYQIKNFDYEDTRIQCGLGKTGGILNITAKDGPHTVSTILNVNFINLDDTPPVFVRDDCSSTCYSCRVPDISVTIDYFTQGIIKTEPSRLKAIDTDSPRSKITYKLTAYPERYIDNIAFENGTFILSQSFANFSNSSESSDFRVVVVLQAFGSNGQKSEPFVLIMHVTLPPTTTKDTTTIEMGILLTTKEGAFDHPMLGESKSDSTKDIAIIVLSISTGLLLIVVIAFIFYKRWSTRTKQESPSTGYEEVKTDNNHQENVYATITL